MKDITAGYLKYPCLMCKLTTNQFGKKANLSERKLKNYDFININKKMYDILVIKINQYFKKMEHNNYIIDIFF